MPHNAPKGQVSLFAALVPLVLLVLALALNVVVFGDAGLDGPNQLALLGAAACAVVIGLMHGHSFEDLLEQVVQSIRTALGAILILLLIGALSGAWLVAGIVPAMIDHGLMVLHPSYFLVAACLACCVVSLATGSSWSTAATVGIALMGIGSALGIHEGLVAGAVISGAYFGDKLSPLSDTTNLAPAVAGAELFGHIRYMLNTTIPSLAIALLLFLVIGLWSSPEGSVEGIASIHEAINTRFHIGWWLYLVPLLFIGTLLGALFAALFQQDLLNDLATVEGGRLQRTYEVLIRAMGGGISITTGHGTVDELLSAGGMAGMLKTIWLILCAMTFGGVMEGAGLLQRITGSLMGLVRGDGSLVATTAASCVFTNVTASDQYLSIVVPGRMFAPVYREHDLDPRVLSRTLEDSGTVTSALVPWNTCGAYMSSVLGVATLTYLPFCFFNLISPLMTVLVAAIGYRILKVPVRTS